MSFLASGLKHLLPMQYCVSGRQCDGISIPETKLELPMPLQVELVGVIGVTGEGDC